MLSPLRGPVPTSTRRRTRSAACSAISCATRPPIEKPSTSTCSSPSALMKAIALAPIPAIESGTSPELLETPALSNRMTSRSSATPSVTAGSQWSIVPIKCMLKTSGAPLVFNMHFMGTMDHWDPAVTDGVAEEREVILFDNAGVSSSSGEVPGSIAEMGANAIAFIKALELEQVDVLGFSIGGLVAQEIALEAPDVVRRLVLVGTGPRSGDSMDTGTPEGKQIFGATYEHPDDLWLRVHFTPSEVSQTAGRKFLKRFRLRGKDRDPEVSEKAALAQRTAIAKWGAKREHAWDYLKD